MAHSIAKWATACKVRGTIPISSILVHLLEERVEGDSSSVCGGYYLLLDYYANGFSLKKIKKGKC